MIAKQDIGPALARLLVAYVALCVIFYLAGASILRPLAPVFGRQIELLRPEVRVETVAIKGSTVSVSVNSVTVPPHKRFRVTADASYGFIYPIVVLSLLAAWPFGRWRPRLVAMGVAVCLLALFVIIDFPLDIAASMTRAFEEKASFGYFFFNNGGRQFVALLIVAAALFAGERARRKPACPDESQAGLRPRARKSDRARLRG